MGLANLANATVIGVNQIKITSTNTTSLQISEVVAISGGFDVALTSAGATTADGGWGWPSTGANNSHPGHTIDGIAPSGWPNIFHSNSPGAGEFLTVILSGSYNIDSLSIFGRNDCCSGRDIYDVELLDASGSLLFSANGQSANNAAHEAVVVLTTVPEPGSLALLSLGVLGLWRVRHHKA